MNQRLIEYLMEQFKDDPWYTKFKIIRELDPDYQAVMRQHLRSDMIHSRNVANCALRVFLAHHFFDDDDPLIPDGSGPYPNAEEYSPSGSAVEVDKKLLSKRWCSWMDLGARLPRGSPSLASVFNRARG